jgi:hypothetical protein
VSARSREGRSRAQGEAAGWAGRRNAIWREQRQSSELQLAMDGAGAGQSAPVTEVDASRGEKLGQG